MKRLWNITTGYNSLNLSRVVNGVSKFRISQFEYTGSDKTVHVAVNNFSKNFDETNSLYYSLFFYCHASSSVTYVPQTDTEGWFTTTGLNSIDVIVYENAAIASSLTNCYVEIEFA